MEKKPLKNPETVGAVPSNYLHAEERAYPLPQAESEAEIEAAQDPDALTDAALAHYLGGPTARQKFLSQLPAEGSTRQALLGQVRGFAVKVVAEKKELGYRSKLNLIATHAGIAADNYFREHSDEIMSESEKA